MGGMLIYTIIYLLRWTCDALGMTILAATSTMSLLSLPIGMTTLSAPILGVRAFTNALFPCPSKRARSAVLGGVGQCFAWKGIGDEVAAWLFGSMVRYHVFI